jgi:hypothetical protein
VASVSALGRKAISRTMLPRNSSTRSTRKSRPDDQKPAVLPARRRSVPLQQTQLSREGWRRYSASRRSMVRRLARKTFDRTDPRLLSRGRVFVRGGCRVCGRGGAPYCRTQSAIADSPPLVIAHRTAGRPLRPFLGRPFDGVHNKSRHRCFSGRLTARLPPIHVRPSCFGLCQDFS